MAAASLPADGGADDFPTCLIQDAPQGRHPRGREECPDDALSDVSSEADGDGAERGAVTTKRALLGAKLPSCVVCPPPSACTYRATGKPVPRDTLVDTGDVLSLLEWDEEHYAWYFAYGSNQKLAKFTARVGHHAARAPFALRGYKLVFNKETSRAGEGYANVEVSCADCVYGMGYLVPRASLLVLDRCEGVPGGHYERSEMWCVPIPRGRVVGSFHGQSKIPMAVYVACSGRVRDNLQPTAGYLAQCLAAESQLPGAYVRWLRSTPTR